ncbi:TPA: hypothetical protein ACQVMA_003403 [Serratia marcescens]|jgi:hypothetical protein|uniref:50S ribosomal protein L29 n=2 Tax=Serratia TaxID=613 RepID=A0AAW6X0A8_9GAMM|nr:MULTISPECIES: hypothetical protein [Serratia]ALL40277.2 hypothetical protein AR325_12790 [Serratia marcescens]APS35501.1 hypothetical protein RN42_17340 [Serratia marcescens]ASM06840.1 hypothetical protein BVG91_07260 [Serratia marcescens]MBH2521306.1 hypothetical protein [Serratia marcescens]MBH2652700.1 hypothetical protein [Serratia ureilytica]
MQTLPIANIEALAARRLSEQQIADVLDISLDELKKDREQLSLFRVAIRKGRAKGEAELRGALYRRAKNGDIQAYSELLRREKQQDSD